MNHPFEHPCSEYYCKAAKGKTCTHFKEFSRVELKTEWITFYMHPVNLYLKFMYSWRELKSDFATIFDFSNSFIVKKNYHFAERANQSTRTIDFYYS